MDDEATAFTLMGGYPDTPFMLIGNDEIGN
jgi:hypothetical protein